MNQQLYSQLKKGCEYKCSKIFCKVDADSKSLKRLSSVLSEYGTIFLCENQDLITQKNSSVAAKHIDKGCVILDYMFFIIAFLEEGDCYNNNNQNNTNLKQEHVHFKNKSSILKEVSFMNKEDEELENCSHLFDTGQCIPMKTFNHLEKCMKSLEQKELHTYCKFLTKEEYLEEEVLLMEGVLYFLVEKFANSSNYFLRPFVVRILSIVINEKKINNYYTRPLLKIFYDMQNIYDEMMETKSLNIAKNMCSQNELCFINPRTTFNDYTNIKLALRSYLDGMSGVDVRENSSLTDMLNIFKILYLINEKTKIFCYEDFYLKNLSRKVNIHEEYCYYKNNLRSMFNFTFILTLSTKSNFIKYENSDLVKESLQETFFRALFEGEKVPYFYIKINRSTLYAQTLKLLRKTPNFDLRKQVKVIFNNEEGEDQGGIKKEYFQLLSEEIREEKRLFINKNDILWFKLDGSSQRPEYESIGKIIGIALYNNVVLNLPFPTLFFKRLLNKETELEDLKEIDEPIFKSLKNLLKMSEEEIKCSGQTFCISYQSGSKIIEKRLIKNGDMVPVTSENIGLFVTRYYKFLTSESVEPFMKSIRRGFLSVIQPTSFEFLHARELEKIIVGSKIINITLLKDTCIYRGYDPDDQIPIWFWEIVSSYDEEKKKKLLQFITGNDRIPVTGSVLRIVFMKNGCDTDRLPSAQTCFNILMIPEYNSKEKLENKINMAINYSKGFYLV
ncbi:hypothetical protein H311_01340 [Anncaliia algerae PRA109]|nr:hypothetical protein H311_01340 [Anncaliia algerae PRA109]